MKVKVIPIIILVSLFSTVGIAFAQKPIGLMMEGYEKDCKVKRGKAEIKCGHLMDLFEGDEIIKLPDVKEVKIQWLYPPYTKGELLNKTTMKISYSPPSDKKALLGLLKDALPFVKESAKVSKPVVTRTLSGSQLDIWIIPRPGYSSTVLKEYPVAFSWGKEGGNSIVFKDSKGNVVFQKDIKGKSSVELTPAEIGLKENEVYTWDIEGIQLDELYTLKLLRDDITQQITSGLNEIENMKISSEEKPIHKALYLQMISDLFPHEFDLYWLSYAIIKPLDNALSRELKKRCILHLNSTSKRR